MKFWITPWVASLTSYSKIIVSDPTQNILRASFLSNIFGSFLWAASSSQNQNNSNFSISSPVTALSCKIITIEKHTFLSINPKSCECRRDVGFVKSCYFCLSLLSIYLSGQLRPAETTLRRETSLRSCLYLSNKFIPTIYKFILNLAAEIEQLKASVITLLWHLLWLH